jgi:GT2 family glycosyltransferase
VSVCAIVVTHNRRALLVECLAALRAQERPVDAVLVVDNASTDGTGELLRTEFAEAEVLSLPENLGSSGGFHAGLERALAGGHDWLWLMDDDTIPSPGALAALLAVPERLAAAGLPPADLLASRVVWRDGRLHPMNAPGADRRDVAHMAAAAQLGLLPLRSTTFVSLLATSEAARTHGLPNPGFFIWSDDLDWTARILRRGHGYLVPESVAEHRTKEPHTSLTEAGPRFYYHLRNTLYMVRRGPWEAGERLALAVLATTSTLAYLRGARLGRAELATVGRALRDGLLRPVPRLPAQTRSDASASG